MLRMITTIPSDYSDIFVIFHNVCNPCLKNFQNSTNFPLAEIPAACYNYLEVLFSEKAGWNND